MIKKKTNEAEMLGVEAELEKVYFPRRTASVSMFCATA
jgi:hypothetical protein